MKHALFDIPTKPRAKPRILAHAVDWGEFPDGRKCAQFVCARCGWDSEHVAAAPDEIRRGIPCERCNP